MIQANATNTIRMANNESVAEHIRWSESINNKSMIIWLRHTALVRWKTWLNNYAKCFYRNRKEWKQTKNNIFILDARWSSKVYKTLKRRNSYSIFSKYLTKKNIKNYFLKTKKSFYSSCLRRIKFRKKWTATTYREPLANVQHSNKSQPIHLYRFTDKRQTFNSCHTNLSLTFRRPPYCFWNSPA